MTVASAATSDAVRKAYATAQARAALLGWALTRTDPADGPQEFTLSRWGRALPVAHSLAEVDAMLTRLGGKAT